MTTTTLYPATEKQIAFIKKLVAEKQTDQRTEDLLTAARAAAMAGGLSSKAASAVIDALIACPRKTDARDEYTAGIYAVDGDTIVRVYLGQQSGVMLAKQVHVQDGEVSYDYLGTARKVLSAATTWTRLELSEVGSLGITSGHCLICGRRLDDPESVDRGIGPVCAENY